MHLRVSHLWITKLFLINFFLNNYNNIIVISYSRTKNMKQNMSHSVSTCAKMHKRKYFTSFESPFICRAKSCVMWRDFAKENIFKGKLKNWKILKNWFTVEVAFCDHVWCHYFSNIINFQGSFSIVTKNIFS